MEQICTMMFDVALLLWKCRDWGAQAKANQQTCSHSIFNPTWMAGKQGHDLSGQYIYIQWNCGLEDTCLVKELISTVSLFTKHYNWCRLENVLRYGGAQILRLFCIPTNLPILLSQRYASKRLQFGLSMTNNVQLSYILPFLANYVKGTLSEIPSFLKCTFNISWIP